VRYGEGYSWCRGVFATGCCSSVPVRRAGAYAIKPDGATGDATGIPRRLDCAAKRAKDTIVGRVG